MAKNKNLSGILNPLLSDPRFEKLKNYGTTLNSFDLNRANEMGHSAILAWLLNPSEAHELHDTFVRRLLIEAYSQFPHRKGSDAISGNSRGKIGKAVFGGELELDLTTLHGSSLCGAIVQTEVVVANGRIDILFYHPWLKLVIAIENKNGSRLHKDQLSKYWKWVDETFPDHCKIFVCLDQSETVDCSAFAPWIYLTYEWIIDFLDQSLKMANLSSRAEVLLGDYVSYLKGEEHDASVQFDNDLVVDVYRSHHEIFEDADVRKMIEDSRSLNKERWKILGSKWTKSNCLQEQWVILRYAAAFQALLDVHRYTPLEQALRKCFQGSEVELKNDRVNLFPREWGVLTDGKFWQLYFRIAFNADAETFELKLCFWIKDVSEERKDRMMKVAELYGKRYFNKSARITILEPLKVPDDIADIPSMIKDKVNEVIEAVAKQGKL